MLPRSIVLLVCASVVLLWAPACGKPVDLKQALQVTNVATGWFDAGIHDGKNKLVPSVTLTIRKTGGADVPDISLNVVFKYEGQEDHADDVFVQRVDFAGDTTAPITVRSQFGYTGDPPQTRAQMLQNSQFRDMEAQIFGKHGSSQWVELHRVKIARQLVTQ
jgi:hypothetical protein